MTQNQRTWGKSAPIPLYHTLIMEDPVIELGLRSDIPG
jgi:hypothetical protein